MAYFANREFQYNGRMYRPDEVIPDFGIGKYDDILLSSGQVGTDGQGTGMEDRIANQRIMRQDTMISQQEMKDDDSAYKADFAKYRGDLEIEARNLR